MDVRSIIEEKLASLNNKEYIFEKVDDKYVSITFNDFIKKVKLLATYMCSNGLINTNILLIGKNSLNYMISDMAITLYTGSCININRDTKEDALISSIKNLNVKGIVYTNDEKDKIESIDLDVFKINVDEVIDTLSEIKDNYKEYNYEECSKIVFSSGTTSKSKGVMLSIKNIFAGWNSLYRRTSLCEDDIVYLWLPLHHTYANVYNFYYSLMSGHSIYISSGINNIISELREVNPTVLCGVPLIFERLIGFYKGNIKEAFGNRIKHIFCGGAVLPIELKQTFIDNGLELLNAYALSETASSFAIDNHGSVLDTSVGTIFEDLDVKIIDQDSDGVGEVCCKGDAVFIGYTDEEFNKDIYTEDNYFKTGDLGYIKDNKLFITGRKKKVLIGSNGENIYVEEIVSLLKEIDTNINDVNVRLEDNNIWVVLYLEDKDKSNLEEVISIYNSKAVQKNRIVKYEVSKEKHYQKLV